MRNFKFAAAMLLAALLLTLGVFAAETVYLDATGVTPGSETTLAAAANAVDDGGRIVLLTDYATPTGAMLTLPQKAVTITAENSATLTLGRVLICGGDTVFENICIANGATVNQTYVEIIYANGHDLTIGQGVTTLPNSTNGNRYFSLAAGINTGTCTGSGKLTVQSGTWRNIYAGNYQGTFAGSADLVVDGGALSGGNVVLGNISTGANTAAVTLTVSGGSLTNIRGGNVPCAAATVTMHGGSATSSAFDTLIDIDAGRSVTLGACTGTLTTQVPEGCTLVQSGTTYTAVADLPDETVYLDATGQTPGAYTTLAAAANAVDDGGRIVLLTDYATPTGAMLTLPQKAVTITAENGAALTLSRGLLLGGDTTFTDIRINNGMSSNYNVYACGHTLTMGSGVTTGANSAGNYLILVAGVNTAATVGGNIVLRAGTFRTVYAGTYNAAMSGNVSILLDGATLTNAIQAGNMTANGVNTANVSITVTAGQAATVWTSNFAGTAALTMTGGYVADSRIDTHVDLAVGQSARLGACTGTLTTSAPEGYEVFVMGDTYTVREEQTGPVGPAPEKVYVDGTREASGDGLTPLTAVKTVYEAAALLSDGGTAVICGNTRISSAVTLPQSGAILFTSVDGDNDYRETAAICVEANVIFGADTTFSNVVIERTKETAGHIFWMAAGHTLTMDTGTVCLNYTTLPWISLVGGNLSGAFTGDTHLVIRAGHFRNVFGGNYNGAFTGDSYLEVTGGFFDNAVCGGSFNGDFTGDAHVTFGGEASVVFPSGGGPQGVVGGCLGENGTTARTFKGNIYLHIEDDSAPVYVFGASRNGNMTTEGNITLTISDNAYIAGLVCGGGYSAGVRGDIRVVMNGGEIQGYLFGGCYSGSVTGNTQVVMNGGKVCYYQVDLHASGSYAAGTRNAYSGCYSGAVSGNADFILRGGMIYGSLYAGGREASATVGGKANLLIEGGRVFGKVQAADDLTLDLRAGDIEIGEASSVTKIIGGAHRLTLAAKAALTVGELCGTVTAQINGLPLPITYFTVASLTNGGEILYIPQEEEKLEHTGSVYSIDFAGASPTVAVTIRYQEGCTCILRAGGARYLTTVNPATDSQFDLDLPNETPMSSTATSTTYMLTPGLYTTRVDHPGSNWRLKSVYVTGRQASQTVDVLFDPADTVGHEGKNGNLHSDMILEKWYDNNDIEGYFRPDTPYFNKRDGSSVFTTNAEMVEFLEEKAENCDWMYLFSDAKTHSGYTVPLCIFTMDEVPNGATPEEIAQIVLQRTDREVLLFDGQVHGNEPCGGEGCLAMISELCGAYGEEVLSADKIGAIIIVPRVNPEGSYRFTRETQYNPLNPNLNRDYMILADVGPATVVRAANLFKPSIYVDCHEAYYEPVYSTGDVLTDIYDIGILYYAGIGSGLTNTKAALYGDVGAATSYGDVLISEALEKLEDIGLRTYYYEKRAMLGFASNYFANTGVYGFIFEVPGIYGGPAELARRSFSQMSGLKSFVALAIEKDGAIMADVNARRRAVAESAQIYDPRMPVVLYHAKSYIQKYNDLLTWNDPLIGADGTVRLAENPVAQDHYHVAVKYRTRPTAYVIPKTAEHLSDVLTTLDRQAVPYYELEDGVTLRLRQYSGNDSQAYLGEERDVTFPSGAVIVPLDTDMANIVANLFEPENPDSPSTSTTFVMAGFLNASEIYRSTESFIAAKLGLAGNWRAVATDGQGAVSSALLDGVATEVYTEDDTAFVLTGKGEHSLLTLNFANGESLSIRLALAPGDVNGDGQVGLLDALQLLSGVLNRTGLPSRADVNGDGKVNIADVIRLLKMLA